MRKIKEVLRLRHERGLSQRQIATSCCVSQSTVAEYLKRAEQAGLLWPLPEGVTEAELERRLFGPSSSGRDLSRPLPDCKHIYDELRR